jgi:hypothetical protein
VLRGFDGVRGANGERTIMGEIAVSALGETAHQKSDCAGPQLCTIDEFPDAITAMLEGHRPSRMPFFENLAAMPHWAASDPSFLGQIHLIYQSAMHATRAAVYYLPHLDSPALRKRKLQIFVDDDGLADGDTHHYQLTRAFRNIGAKCVLEDEEFGDPTRLCRYLDGETARFVTLTRRLYARSLGPWCAIETMSVDWMRALAEALSIHFPRFKHEPYFEECFSHRVEERHAAEALEVTQLVLRARPALLVATMRDAKTIARALDRVWTQLDRITRRAAATRKDGRGTLRRGGSAKAATAPLP